MPTENLATEEPQFNQRLIELLRDFGYRATARHHSMIESATNGSNFSIFVQQDGWFQFGLRFVNSVGFRLEDVNNFNLSYRFGKLCLDADGDLFFSADMRVSATALKETFKDCLDLWDQLVGVLIRSLRPELPAPS
jgi:hypothetical protein